MTGRSVFCSAAPQSTPRNATSRARDGRETSRRSGYQQRRKSICDRPARPIPHLTEPSRCEYGRADQGRRDRCETWRFLFWYFFYGDRGCGILFPSRGGVLLKPGSGVVGTPGGASPGLSSRADRSPIMRQTRRASRKLLITLHDPAPRKGRISLSWA